MGVREAGASLDAHRQDRTGTVQDRASGLRFQRSPGMRLRPLDALLEVRMAAQLQITESPGYQSKKEERKKPVSETDCLFSIQILDEFRRCARNAYSTPYRAPKEKTKLGYSRCGFLQKSVGVARASLVVGSVLPES